MVAWKFLALGFIFCVLGAVKVLADDWEGTKYDDLGISQEEFQKVKETGMPRAKLMKLLELGISPNEYFSEPWKKLGVSEDHWLSEKKGGMADDDIDRSYRKQGFNNMTPFISFILPGYYQYKTNRLYFGLGLSTTAVAAWTLTFLHKNSETKAIYPVYPVIAVAAMFWSAADAYIGSRYNDNQEAQRFSWNLGLSSSGSPLAGFSLRF